MPSAVSGFTPTQTAATNSSSSLKGMTSGDFLKLMIQQLQQQDPLNPTDANQLLTQMSQISTLQSNTTMQESLQSLNIQQSIGSAGNLIGKTVNGIDDDGNAIKGVVTSVRVVEKKVRLELDSGHDLPMENVTQIATASSSTLGDAASALAQAQQYLNNSASTTGTTTPTTTTTDTMAQLLQLLGSTGIPGTNTVATPGASSTGSVPTPTGSVAPLSGASGS